MKTSDVAAGLDRVLAAARRSALMGGVVIGDVVERMYAVHSTLKAKHTSGELNDEQYAEKVRELLEMLGRLGVVMAAGVSDPAR